LRKNRLIFAALSLALLAIVACGKKGNPRPLGLPVPRVINDLRGDAKDGVLFISFSIPTKNRNGTDVSGLEGFRIMKSCGACGGGFDLWKNIRLADKQGYTIRDNRLYTYDDDLRSGVVYGYRVYPYNTKGIQMDGSTVFSLTWLKPPEKPAGVTAEEEDSRIVLSWEKTDELSYNVYRWDNGTYPLFPRNSGPLAAASFTDAPAQNGKTYKYEVRAVRMEGTTPFEGEGATIFATPRDKTPPAPPATPMLSMRDGGVFLSWAPSTETDLAGYNVYRLAAGKPEKVNTSLLPEPRFFDKNPGADLRYVSYYVTAVDVSGNESGPSREQIIILKE
jgi:predicted small lipoprotein YifL